MIDSRTLWRRHEFGLINPTPAGSGPSAWFAAPGIDLAGRAESVRNYVDLTLGRLDEQTRHLPAPRLKVGALGEHAYLRFEIERSGVFCSNTASPRHRQIVQHIPVIFRYVEVVKDRHRLA